MLTLTKLLLADVAANHRVTVLIHSIGEVLTGHADTDPFPALKLPLVYEIPLLHRQLLDSTPVLLQAVMQAQPEGFQLGGHQSCIHLQLFNQISEVLVEREQLEFFGSRQFSQAFSQLSDQHRSFSVCHWVVKISVHVWSECSPDDYSLIADSTNDRYSTPATAEKVTPEPWAARAREVTCYSARAAARGCTDAKNKSGKFYLLIP